MPTSDLADVFPEPPVPLRPARGRLTVVFVVVVGLGLVLAQALGDPGDAGSGGALSGVAPEIALTTFDGSSWRLSEHLAEDGRPVVLNLWASWCLPCREEIPELSIFSDSHPGFLVVGVAVDDRLEPARRLVDELVPSYLVGMDDTGRLRDRYPSAGMPFTVVIDRQGVIRWSKVGGVTASELRDVVSAIG
jgi:cytochrome c biogenesis protein CcmG, thiol:disulfide interchange protein DsbE